MVKYKFEVTSSKLNQEDKNHLKSIKNNNVPSDVDLDSLLQKVYNSLEKEDRKEFNCYWKRFVIEHELYEKIEELKDKCDCSEENYSFFLMNCNKVKEAHVPALSCERGDYTPEEYEDFLKLQIEHGKSYNTSIHYMKEYNEIRKLYNDGNIEKANKKLDDLDKYQGIIPCLTGLYQPPSLESDVMSKGKLVNLIEEKKLEEERNSRKEREQENKEKADLLRKLKEEQESKEAEEKASLLRKLKEEQEEKKEREEKEELRRKLKEAEEKAERYRKLSEEEGARLRKERKEYWENNDEDDSDDDSDDSDNEGKAQEVVEDLMNKQLQLEFKPNDEPLIPYKLTRSDPVPLPDIEESHAVKNRKLKEKENEIQRLKKELDEVKKQKEKKIQLIDLDLTKCRTNLDNCKKKIEEKKEEKQDKDDLPLVVPSSSNDEDEDEDESSEDDFEMAD